MAINVYPLGEEPRPTRNKRRTMEQSDEWISLKAKMAEGINPFEIIIVTFTAADKTKFRIKGPQRVFRDMAKDWIRKRHLPYSVDAYKSEGNDVVKVWNEPPITSSNVPAMNTPGKNPRMGANAVAPEIETKTRVVARKKRRA